MELQSKSEKNSVCPYLHSISHSELNLRTYGKNKIK